MSGSAKVTISGAKERVDALDDRNAKRVVVRDCARVVSEVKFDNFEAESFSQVILELGIRKSAGVQVVGNVIHASMKEERKSSGG